MTDDVPLDIDSQMYKRLQDKEHEAWKQVFSHYQPWLFQAVARTLIRHELSVDDARVKDIASKTWHTALHNIDEFTDYSGDSMHRWLYTIQRNHIRNLSRKRENQNTSLDAHDNWVNDLPEDDGSPMAHARGVENAIIERENRLEIMRAVDVLLEDLSPRNREIVLQRWMYDESPAVLAKKHGLSVNTIHQIVSRTKKTLKEYSQTPELFKRANVNHAKRDKETKSDARTS